MARAMQRRCCWPPDTTGSGLVQAILYLVPDGSASKRFLNDFIELRLVSGKAMNARTIGDIVIDRLRKRVRFLEDHPYFGAKLDRVDLWRVDVFAVKRDLTLDPANVDRVVHPVQTAQEGRLAATRGPDEGSHRFVEDIYVDILDGMVVAIIHLHAARRDLVSRSAHVIFPLYIIHWLRPSTSGARTVGAVRSQ